MKARYMFLALILFSLCLPLASTVSGQEQEPGEGAIFIESRYVVMDRQTRLLDQSVTFNLIMIEPNTTHNWTIHADYESWGPYMITGVHSMATIIISQSYVSNLSVAVNGTLVWSLENVGILREHHYAGPGGEESFGGWSRWPWEWDAAKQRIVGSIITAVFIGLFWSGQRAEEYFGERQGARLIKGTRVAGRKQFSKKRGGT